MGTTYEPDAPEASACELEEFQRRHREAVARNMEDQKPVIQALRRAGFVVDTIDQLPIGCPGFDEALPILMEWLPKVDNVDIKAAIVSQLAGRWGRPAGPLLIDEFKKYEEGFVGERPSLVGWGIGNALYEISDRHLYREMLALVEDDGYGTDRQMLVAALGRIGDARAVPTLIRLLDDDTLVGHAVIALGNLKAREARVAIEGLKDHSRKWVRAEAKKALAKIDKAAAQ
jgi:hypothetical protein